MKPIILFQDSNHEYFIFLQTSFGLEPFMHSNNGLHQPMKFKTELEAQLFLNSTNASHWNSFLKDFDHHKIVYFLSSNGWVDHYEILKKEWFHWRPIMTWHPQTGDKPKMFLSWDLAHQFLKENLIESNITSRRFRLKI